MSIFAKNDKMAQHNTLGKQGEDKAADYLRHEGYLILDRNWRVGHLELDFVCRDGNVLVVVEVKTRQEEDENPDDLLGWRKRRNLLKAADAYVKKKGLDMEIRFDLLIVSAGDWNVEHIKEAINILD